jgi:hypothetical protein
MEIIPIATLDTFLDRKRKINVMKIDVEGFEYKVLRGALATVSRWRPKIYLEYADSFQRSGSGVPGARLLELMVDLSFQPTILHRNKPPERIEGDKNNVVTTLDKAWESVVNNGGTHVDLYWDPGRVIC